MIADRMILQQAWVASAVSRPLACILGDRCCGIEQASELPGLRMPYVVGHGLGFFHLRRAIGLGLLLRQLTRMHHDEGGLIA